jgi:hypothetical protein
MQVSEVNHVRVEKSSIIGNVAQTNIKVPVHPLQRADDDAIFRRGHPEAVAVDRHCAIAVAKRSRQRRVLACLPQPSDMNFDQLRKAGYYEVPFVGQAVSPTAVGDARLELRLHYGDDLRCFGVGVKIQIAAEIRPVVQGLDYGG